MFAGPLAVVVFVVGAMACAEADETGATEQTITPAAKAEPEATVEEESAGQENARESAESYLETGSFSRSGLFEQLRFEGFTPAQAKYGVQKAY